MPDEDAETLADEGLDPHIITPDEVAAAEPAPEPDPAEHPPVVTDCAFLVYLDQAGHWVADHDVLRPVVKRREANTNDFLHAASDIAKDVTAFDTANRVVATQQAVAQQMAQQMEAQAIARQVHGQPGGGMPPAGIDLSQFKRR